jgi:hypothetical protein
MSGELRRLRATMQPKHWLDWPLTLNARGVHELMGASLGSYRESGRSSRQI